MHKPELLFSVFGRPGKAATLLSPTLQSLRLGMGI